MANDLKQSVYVEDEIDLNQMFKILLESKKLIISTLLIFTTVSIIFYLSQKPSFETSTNLEVGYVERINGDRELIESASSLISNLKILLMKNPDGKFNQDVSMNSFEDKIIKLETSSSSAEQNENLLNEMINYVDERHSMLTAISTDFQKNQIYYELDFIESELSFIKTKKLNENELVRSKIEDRIEQLKSELPFIEIRISQLNQVIFEDTNNLSLLKENDNLLKTRAAISPTLEQIIFSYKSQINDLNIKKSTNILETKSLINQLENFENAQLQSDEIFRLEDEIFRLEQEQKTLENQLKIIENAPLQSDEIFRLEQEQKTLENQLQTLMSQSQIETQIFGDIETKIIKPKALLIISLGIILGFITSIFLVLINNFIKSFRESQV